ncbi:MAG: hypothetical protein IKG17_06325 [Mogibacterium sp.]|nr:hypothetical protein [Mogibacterium sp.]
MNNFIIIAICVAAVGTAYYLKNREKTGLLQEGKIIERNKSFWEDKQIFELDAPYEAVVAAAKNVNYAGNAVEVTYNFDGKKIIFFRSSHSWNAALQYLGTSEEKYLYSLSFTNWKGRNGVPNFMTMNIFLTQTEKMLLSLDPETMVETHMMEIKTKTRF